MNFNIAAFQEDVSIVSTIFHVPSSHFLSQYFLNDFHDVMRRWSTKIL